MNAAKARHPPIGTLVRDLTTGAVGVLTAVDTLLDMQGNCLRGPRAPLAFLRPRGGGREWTVSPDEIAPVEEGAR